MRPALFTAPAVEPAWNCTPMLQENAPQRPVRLLGVRVAGLTHGEEPAPALAAAEAEPQMALPL